MVTFNPCYIKKKAGPDFFFFFLEEKFILKVHWPRKKGKA